jgi:hypothetical protein
VTYSLEGMRQALLAGAGMVQLWPSVRALFSVVLLPLSGLIFAWAVRRTKITGTLTHLYLARVRSLAEDGFGIWADDNLITADLFDRLLNLSKRWSTLAVLWRRTRPILPHGDS